MASYTVTATVTSSPSKATGTGSAAFTVNAATPAQCYFGIWDDADGYPGTSIAGTTKFSAAPVKSATYYLAHEAPWVGSGAQSFTQLCGAAGITPYLNLEPWDTWGGGANPSMTDIANGVYDSYYIAFAQGVKAQGVLVYMTFAHEMNGTWYPWGAQAISPATWLAAWKHVHDVMNANAGGFIKWVWAPNNIDVGSCVPYWPGPSYADIAGFDGYLNAAGQTYASFVKQTVTQIRTLTTTLPIWNAETGIEPNDSTRLARITQFVSDMHADGLYGFTWFNEGTFLLSTAETQALTSAVNTWN